MEDRGTVLPAPLPGGDVEELVVVPHGLTLGRLGFRPEVAAAGLTPVQGVDAHELGQLEEVQQPAGLLQGLVELVGLARDTDVAPELLRTLLQLYHKAWQQ